MGSRFLGRAPVAGAGVALAILIGWLLLRGEPAPQPAAPQDFNPAQFVRSRTSLDAPYVVTNYEVVDAMLALADVRPDDFVVDLGSGDGRILIAAARSHGARGLGVDIDPARIRESTANARNAGVAHRVSFRRQNLFDTPLAEADVLTLYLTAETNLRLRPRILSQLRPGTRVVSNEFDMGSWRYDRRQRIGAATIYMWVVPARAAGSYALHADGRTGVLTLQQEFQQLTGSLTANGGTSRVEQGWVAGDRIRFIADLGDGRREYEGRIAGGRLELTGQRRWRADPVG